jgi:hypothetical protein
MTAATPTDRKMPFDSQEEYEAACKKNEGKPMTKYKPETTKYLYAYQRIISRSGDGSYTTNGIVFSEGQLRGQDIQYVGRIRLEQEEETHD